MCVCVCVCMCVYSIVISSSRLFFCSFNFNVLKLIYLEVISYSYKE